MRVQILPSGFFRYKLYLFGIVVLILIKLIINYHFESLNLTNSSSCRCEYLKSDVQLKPLPPDWNNMDKQSACSDEVTELGFGQKVVSFSLFVYNGEERKPIFAKYGKGVSDNLIKIRELYPGWVMRLYTNLAPENMTIVANILSEEEDFFICNVNTIPKYGNLSELSGHVARFLPLGDPTVDLFISRDLDSLVNERERAAVAEWEASDKPFHGMRDHTAHFHPILAGMWGAYNSRIQDGMKSLLISQFIEMGKTTIKGDDQKLLAGLLYIPYKHLFLIHDSYFCVSKKDSVPFPTKRVRNEFVGSFYMLPNIWVLSSCPIDCRPSYGKSWEFC